MREQVKLTRKAFDSVYYVTVHTHFIRILSFKKRFKCGVELFGKCLRLLLKQHIKRLVCVSIKINIVCNRTEKHIYLVFYVVRKSINVNIEALVYVCLSSTPAMEFPFGTPLPIFVGAHTFEHFIHQFYIIYLWDCT